MKKRRSSEAQPVKNDESEAVARPKILSDEPTSSRTVFIEFGERGKKSRKIRSLADDLMISMMIKRNN